MMKILKMKMMEVVHLLLNNRQINEWVLVVEVVVRYHHHNDLVQIRKWTIQMNDGKTNIELNEFTRSSFSRWLALFFFSSLTVSLFFVISVFFFFRYRNLGKCLSIYSVYKQKNENIILEQMDISSLIKMYRNYYE